MTVTADLLEQTPDLGEDVKDPEDCFTEGLSLGGPLPQPQPCLEKQGGPAALGCRVHITPHPGPAASPPSPIHQGPGGSSSMTESWQVCQQSPGLGSCGSAAQGLVPLHLWGGSMTVHSHSGRAWVSFTATPSGLGMVTGISSFSSEWVVYLEGSWGYNEGLSSTWHIIWGCQ